MTESRKEINRITDAVSDQTTLIHQIKEGLTITKENLERTNTEIGTQSGLIQQIEEGIAITEENFGKTVTEIGTQSGLIQQIKEGLTITEENLGRTNTEIGAQFSLIQQIKEGLTITEENLGRTNTEIGTQSSIIQQIITALEGKASGGGTVLPTLENPGSASDLALGKQLIGANGKVVEGVVPVVTNAENARAGGWDVWDSDVSQNDDPYVYDFPGCVQTLGRTTEDILIKQYAGIFVYVPKAQYGDAKPEDVAQGKTFTSEAGVRVEGTATLGGAEVKTATARPSSNSTSISFTGLTAQPKMFAVCPTGNVTFNAQNRFIVNVMYDGTTTRGIYAVGSGSWNATYTGTHSATYFSWTYNNGTLTIKTSSNTNGGYFASGVTYQLTYVA